MKSYLSIRETEYREEGNKRESSALLVYSIINFTDESPGSTCQSVLAARVSTPPALCVCYV